jgi:hypothetical protein
MAEQLKTNVQLFAEWQQNTVSLGNNPGSTEELFLTVRTFAKTVPGYNEGALVSPANQEISPTAYCVSTEVERLFDAVVTERPFGVVRRDYIGWLTHFDIMHNRYN